MLKINSIGVIEWQNVIGGKSDDFLYSVSETLDGNFIIGGYSDSQNTGDKTEMIFGNYDIWILKLNSAGVIIWQNDIGGTSNEYLSSIKQTSDGGFIIGGYSFSNISGDKTAENIGSSDYWLIKLDQWGNIIWQEVLGGTDFDALTSLEQTFDGGLLLGGYSNSMISGDKTEDAWLGGIYSYDYWVIKLSPTCLPTPEICNALDDNCNGLIDDAITETISISAGGPITFCQGGNVLLTATYSGATLQWKKNGTNISCAVSPTYLVTTKGTFTCVTTSLCGTATSVGIFVNVNKNPLASITAGGATTFCAGGSVVLTANAGGGFSYQWYKGASLLAGATSINYTATLAGNYKCQVTKTATGCYKNSNVIAVTVPCKEEEKRIQNADLIIYPNPNTGTFSISVQAELLFSLDENSTTLLELCNAHGQIIYSQ